mgnify:CR=1 FL=1
MSERMNNFLQLYKNFHENHMWKRKSRRESGLLLLFFLFFFGLVERVVALVSRLGKSKTQRAGDSRRSRDKQPKTDRDQYRVWHMFLYAVTSAATLP